ncbi:cyclic nucleotide-gated cation channel beta-1 [Tribolium castaneum]|uniref:Cyclic nucleotide-gated cation channel subunit A-like Protein n=1 Tax=Tribolium castaneum TaxID=7070 RepID=D6WKV5_TRICA|nr:PREDICTED: cyclic nucleotide-gated cation channel beta-1 [Tribolium castaneum]EFA04022.1 Cyclic nucleotide-gated cation channel subunit A-like Protein [Tribolium castaneum]|eukprot:XP_008193618.1 PREDICTED: cyclic nucleotide-gated cation channel beta-1 [Tribolium castaneum]
MENIYRFKKRMVYPEKLTLDQVGDKTSSAKSSSWCNGPLEKTHKINVHSVKKTCKSEVREQNRSPSFENYSTSANRQFIQDRIRHLVDAFSTRAQAARERIETPATPSSISSRETVEPPPVQIKPKLSTTSDKSISEVPQTKSKSNSIYRNIKYILDNKVIDPNGKVYITWMSIAAMAVMYNAWVIPLRSTFPYQTPQNRPVWMAFDYLADFVYLLDMILIQPRVKYLNEGFWVTDMAQLRYNYIKKRAFKLDLVSLIPLDLLYLILGPECVILRFPRFFKLHTFWEFFSFVDKLLANPYIIRITRTLMYMMYLIHINACAYYAFSSWEGIGSNNFVFDGVNNAYIKCFYFATKTATSIGKNPKPTQEIEYMFMTVSWLMGVFVFALLIGQIRDIISTATRSKTEYRKLVDETLEYMRRLNLPQDMQRRVQLWFNYTWETQHTLDEKNILDCLPHKMKTDIAINVHIQTLSKVKLFADCDEALLRELVLQLKSVIYLPGDIICKKGDVGKEMYIIQCGKVQVIGRHENDVLATLSEGSVFGEISLLGIPGMNRRTADVRSQGHSNLFVLSKADLNAALSHYPEAQELLNKKAKMLMKKNAALERKHNAMIIIDNPTPPAKQAKLLDTVLQVVPPDSKTNRLLRYGSKGKPRGRPENDRFKYRNSLPSIKGIDRSFQTKVTVHRTMS